LAERPDIVVVSNPTALHVPVALAAVRAGAHVLIEKPISNSLDGCELLGREALGRSRVVKVAMNMRFHPVLRQAQSIIAQQRLGRPLLGQAHFGSYLPDWHPWEDYLKSYAARRDLGGGAALTHIHEMDYMLWLLGAADDAHGFASRRSPLGTEVDEACGLVILHTSGAVSTITLSLAQKPASRRVEIFCDHGCLSLDLIEHSWSLQPTNGDAESGSADGVFQVDETYRIQASTFLEVVRTGVDSGMLPGIEEACAALRVSLSVNRDDRKAHD